MTKVRLDFRIEDYEMEILNENCSLTGRTKTDVLRELIRKLKAENKRIKVEREYDKG